MKTLNLLLVLLLLNVGFTTAKDSTPLDQAKLLVATNKTRDAIPVLEKLIAAEPESAPHNYFLGMCLIKEGIRIEEAVKYLEKAAVDYSSTDLDPGMGEPEFVWYYMVIGYSRMKECEKAKERYDKFVQVYSKGDPFYTNEAVKWIELCHEPMRMAQEIKTRSYINAHTYLKDRLVTAAPEDEISTREVNFTTQSVLYGVQVGAAIKPTYTTEFKGLKNVGVYVDENKVYRYVIGNLGFRSQAEELLEEVKAKGYPDAFIVDINQPETYGEEVTSLNNVSIAPQLRGKVEFRVQIGAFAETLPKDLRKFYFEVDQLKTAREGDLTIMTAGKFDTYEEAQAQRDLLQNQGLADCFVTAFNKRNRIPVKVALDFLNENQNTEIVPQKRGKK
ncbi:MAG: SPOR domain-containing protein [Flavobacteriales bacterium]|nr:SPOR domain-containing protein [Flavobacteriales bacterium]